LEGLHAKITRIPYSGEGLLATFQIRGLQSKSIQHGRIRIHHDGASNFSGNVAESCHVCTATVWRPEKDYCRSGIDNIDQIPFTGIIRAYKDLGSWSLMRKDNTYTRVNARLTSLTIIPPSECATKIRGRSSSRSRCKPKRRSFP
jgi:hypothetical protein